ncbi:MAG: hypothetical protein ABSB76_28210 [Streptosporangiaceae bacterium]
MSEPVLFVMLNETVSAVWALARRAGRLASSGADSSAAEPASTARRDIGRPAMGRWRAVMAGR